MWKCAFCGAMNEDENLVCDGCGDERPMSPQTTGSKLDKRQDFEDMGRKPPNPSAPTLDNDDNETDENIEGKDDQDNDEPAQASDNQDIDADTNSTPETFKADKDEDGGNWDSGPDFSTDTTISSPSSSQSTPPSSPEPISSYAPPQPSSYPSATSASDAAGAQGYAMVFINTPAQSLIKSRVSIEFDDFPVISIGRNPENVVVIPDQEVSRKHAQLSVENGKLMLKDLQSANGTYIYDGKQFQRVNGSVEIKPNSIVKFGSGTIVRLENG